MAVERLVFVALFFSCGPCQEAQEILQMAGQGSEEPISISNTLQPLGANEWKLCFEKIQHGSGVLKILNLTKLIPHAYDPFGAAPSLLSLHLFFFVENSGANFTRRVRDLTE